MGLEKIKGALLNKQGVDTRCKAQKLQVPTVFTAACWLTAVLSDNLLSTELGITYLLFAL